MTTISEKPGRAEELMHFISQLYPICRSITGNGVRETLRLIQEHIPVEVHEVPTGTRVLDWEVPKEWNIRDAFVKNSEGEKIIDFSASNLHILNYSIPVNKKMNLKELRPHLFSIPEKPKWIPYRTSYYSENWGFCISHDQLTSMKDEEYEVVIDSDLSPGYLTYGELFLKGKSEEEVIISTHICHPSLCNDNLSGISVCTYLAKELLKTTPYYSYRFLFIPATIGAVTWLSLNEGQMQKIKYGLVIALMGIDALFTYKRSRQGSARIDKIVEHVLSITGKENKIIDFVPYGYDERQFCSPGFNLPVGNLSRIPFGEFPEYHTSADNINLVSDKAMENSLLILQKIVTHIEADRHYVNLYPKGEPQLGRHGLYDHIGGRSDSKILQLALLWMLNYSDGKHSINDISILSGLELHLLTEAADLLEKKGLIVIKKVNL